MRSVTPKPATDPGPALPGAPVAAAPAPTFVFERPAELEATLPPELHDDSCGRDDVRLLVSSPAGHRHHHFRELPGLLRRGDLLVVNDSATLPASLQAEGPGGAFTLNLSTRYGADTRGRELWLAEPRRSPERPGPLPWPLEPAQTFVAAGLRGRLLTPHADIPRLWFVRFETAGTHELDAALAQHGQPIRYRYVREPLPLASYQTIFAAVPGSAEMPSAGRPFTQATLRALARRGIELAAVTLHTGVSSLDGGDLVSGRLYAEPFAVPAKTAAAIGRARAAGRRVIAVGTTVVRALASASQNGRVRPAQGFTRLYLQPDEHAATRLGVIDGLLTGLHDPGATHLAMLAAVAGGELVRDGYAAALAGRYLWHEFGDLQLLLPRDRATPAHTRFTPGRSMTIASCCVARTVPAGGVD